VIELTHGELKQKVIRESSSRPKGMGHYAVASYLLRFLSDIDKVRRFMEKEGYTKTEISNALTQRKRDILHQKTHKYGDVL
jgi:hypothetical protein